MKDHLGNNLSVWPAETSVLQAASLSENIDADICVIGGGIAGMTTAYLLAKEGREVVILEADQPGSGQTARTSAHLSCAIDDRIYEIERIHGLEAAKIAVQSHRAAIDCIENIVREEGIDCDFYRVDGYLFCAPENDESELDKELEAAHRAGLTDVEKLDRLGTGKKDLGPCLRFPNQARFQPLDYLHGLQRALKAMGAKIYSSTRVTGVSAGPTCYLDTEKGSRVSAGTVVVATNSPITNRVLLQTKMHPYLTYVVAMEIASESVPDALYWDMADPYHYVRLTEHKGKTLLLVGGEDHKTGHEIKDADPYSALEAWARERFTGLKKVAFHWSGQVMETIDGLAFIGKNPLEFGEVYVACGDSGMGLTHGTIAGILLTDLIQHRKNPWEAIYSPGRKPLKAASEYFLENAEMAFQYKDHFTPGESISIEAIPRNSGAVLRRGLHKVAVYRAKDGEIHTCSAVCPHLAAIVHWNDDEKTWDCPAHGSRFGAKGECIQGPAYQSLASIAEDEQSLPRPAKPGRGITDNPAGLFE